MSDAQARITAFWSTITHDYEAHGGNVATFGTEAYQLWVDALGAVLPDLPAEILTNRHLLWTLREPATAMANWHALLRPGGRLVAIDGFWFSGAEGGEAPPLFARHDTSATQDELPFMHLDRPEPIVEMLRGVGFVEVTAQPHPELALEGGAPFFITAKRP